MRANTLVVAGAILMSGYATAVDGESETPSMVRREVVGKELDPNVRPEIWQRTESMGVGYSLVRALPDRLQSAQVINAASRGTR
jgi:hypothetical protein